MRVLIVIYDNGGHISYFPVASGYIVAALQNAGHEVDIWHQDIHHYPSEQLTDVLNQTKYDVVGLGVIGGYYQYQKLKELSQAINRSDQRPFYMVGGHMCSPDPEYFIKKCGIDAVIVGEGEKTVVNLLNALETQQSLTTVDGIVFSHNDVVTTNAREKLIDIDSISQPAYDSLNVNYYRLRDYHNGRYLPNNNPHNNDFCLSLLSGRGCPFKCSFCYRLEKGFRGRSPESIIAEMEFLYRQYNIKYFLFIDELLMAGYKRIQALCDAFIKYGMKERGLRWGCSGRLNYATSETMELMKAAGCIFIHYGVEALDNNVLAKMNKKLTVDKIHLGIDATIKSGINPGYSVMWGSPGDNLHTLDKLVQFLNKYDNGTYLRTIRPVTPYPGSPLYYDAIEQGLLDSKNSAEDFYERRCVNSDLISCNFMDIPTDVAHIALYKANQLLIKHYYNNVSDNTISSVKDLYEGKTTIFRGYNLV